MIVIYNWLEGSPELDQLDTIIKQSSHASAVRSFSFHIYDDKPERLAKIRKICMDRIISGKIVPHFYMDLPLSEARKAHELMDGLQIMGKLILHVEEKLVIALYSSATMRNTLREFLKLSRPLHSVSVVARVNKTAVSDRQNT